MAGRAMIRKSDGSIVSHLVKIEKPSMNISSTCTTFGTLNTKLIYRVNTVLRVPTLAIHLDRQEKFEYNKETQLFPILGLAAAELNKSSATKSSDDTKTEEAKTEEGPFSPLAAITERHHPAVVSLIAEATSSQPEDVVDFEMLLYDTQKGVQGGLNDEFIFAARLDNQVHYPISSGWNLKGHYPDADRMKGNELLCCRRSDQCY